MHLYKYASFEVGHRILSTGKLRWATPKTLNDPFDMQFAFQMRIHRPQARAMALNKAWEHHYGPFRDKPLNALGLLIRATRGKFPQLTRDEFDREIGAGIDESIDTIEKQLETFAEKIRSHVAYDKIFCVSASASNILMWSYYAQNHSGVVLRFTTETPENPLRLARAVTYIDQVPALFDDDLLSDMLAGYEVMDQRRILNEVVWSKSSHWAHEEEWRVYVYAVSAYETELGW